MSGIKISPYGFRREGSVCPSCDLRCHAKCDKCKKLTCAQCSFEAGIDDAALCPKCRKSPKARAAIKEKHKYYSMATDRIKAIGYLCFVTVDVKGVKLLHWKDPVYLKKGLKPQTTFTWAVDTLSIEEAISLANDYLRRIYHRGWKITSVRSGFILRPRKDVLADKGSQKK